MKKLLIVLVVSFILITSLSAFEIYYTSGCPNHSSSPADGLNCNSCHSGGAVSPIINISSIPALGVGNTYIPGTTYTISISGTGYGFYGFDLEILNSQSSIASSVLDFGVLNNVNPNETINSPSPGYGYSDIMHTTPSATGFDLIWTAPSSGTGFLYCALLGVNNTGSTSGDKCSTTTMTLTPSNVNNIIEHSENNQPIDISVYPNPCKKTINFSYQLKATTNFEIELHSINGAIKCNIINKKQEKGLYYMSYNLPQDISNGIYILKTNTNNFISEKKILIENE